MPDEPAPVTLSDEARDLLREQIAASGIARPFVRIGIRGAGDSRRAAAMDEDDDGPDWTIRRRDLWTVEVAGDERTAQNERRFVVVEGIRFACDFFPMRFDISVRNGRFLVAAFA